MWNQAAFDWGLDTELLRTFADEEKAAAEGTPSAASSGTAAAAAAASAPAAATADEDERMHDSKGYTSLRRIHEQMREVANAVNAKVREAENRAKLFDIYKNRLEGEEAVSD